LDYFSSLSGKLFIPLFLLLLYNACETADATLIVNYGHEFVLYTYPTDITDSSISRNLTPYMGDYYKTVLLNGGTEPNDIKEALLTGVNLFIREQALPDNQIADVSVFERLEIYMTHPGLPDLLVAWQDAPFDNEQQSLNLYKGNVVEYLSTGRTYKLLAKYKEIRDSGNLVFGVIQYKLTTY
jgi:hypothetical protein